MRYRRCRRRKLTSFCFPSVTGDVLILVTRPTADALMNNNLVQVLLIYRVEHLSAVTCKLKNQPFCLRYYII